MARVGAEGEREEIQTSKCLERFVRTRIRVDRGAKIVRNRGLRRRANRRIGRVPAAVGLGGIDLPLSGQLHAPGSDQSPNVLAVDLAPDAPGSPRGVTLQKGFVVERFADAVDPAPAELPGPCAACICTRGGDNRRLRLDQFDQRPRA